MFAVVAERGRNRMSDRVEFDTRGEAEDCFNRFMDDTAFEYAEYIRLYSGYSILRGWTNPQLCSIYSEISNGEGCDAFPG